MTDDRRRDPDALAAAGCPPAARGGPAGRGGLLRSPRRLVLAGLGLVCVGLGLVGVVVPGLPTTVFLIAASYLFARSCPVLEERLLRIRPFRPYLKYVSGERAMPREARLAALAMMWTAVSASLLVLASGDRLGPVPATVILGAAAVGTVVIVRIRRTGPARAPGAADPPRVSGSDGPRRRS